jgi:hypothetical protein
MPIGAGEPCELAPPFTTLCGSAGTSGCGGGLGTGGGGSSGGGSSVGVFAWDAVVEVVDTAIAASDGGIGAVGALGGQPGNGSTGVAGTQSAYCLTACGFNCLQTGSSLAGGTAGGVGGKGSTGGRGGGGSGGSSYAVYLGGTATLLPSGTIERTFGLAGTSAGNGAAGFAKEIGP